MVVGVSPVMARQLFLKPKMPKGTKILLFSSCSSSLRNKGDYAMLLGMVQQLSTLQPGAELILYARGEELFQVQGTRGFWSPERYFSDLTKGHDAQGVVGSTWARLRVLARGLRFLGHFAVFRLTGPRFLRNSSYVGFFSHMLDARAVVLTGGGYLNSLWWLYGLYAKAFVIILSRFLGIPVLLTGQSIGPFTNALDRFVVRLVLNCATVIGLREEQSREVLKGFGRSISSKIVITGDDALWLQRAEKTELQELFMKENIPLDTELVGVNLRDSSKYGNNYQQPKFEKFAKVLDHIVAVGNRHIVFIPISYHGGDDDRKSAAEVVDRMKYSERVTIVKGEYGPSEIKALIGSMYCVIGTSYHFSLFALSQSVPAVGIYQDSYYELKLKGLFNLYGLDRYAVDVSCEEIEVLMAKTQEMLLHRDDVVSELRQRNEQIYTNVMSVRESFQNILLGA